MHTIHSFLFQAHVGFGSVALIAFWLPIATRKGSSWHRRSGRVFAWCMYAVAISALLMSSMVLIDPIGVREPQRNLEMSAALQQAARDRMFNLFLLMLGLLVLTSLRHGLLALRSKSNPLVLRHPVHLTLIVALAVVAIAVGWIGINNGQLLLVIFAGISLSASVSLARESLGPPLTGKTRIKAHFNGLIGTGIGAYTAFFAFGGARLLSGVLSGQWQVIPWILPAIIGTIAIRRLERQQQAGSTA